MILPGRTTPRALIILDPTDLVAPAYTRPTVLPDPDHIYRPPNKATSLRLQDLQPQRTTLNVGASHQRPKETAVRDPKATTPMVAATIAAVVATTLVTVDRRMVDLAMEAIARVVGMEARHLARL